MWTIVTKLVNQADWSTAGDCSKAAGKGLMKGSGVSNLGFGDYLFVHAGIRPGVEFDQQQQSDLRWIREPFLFDDTDHGFVVVHGHTIRDEVEERPNRIGIDTGAYRSGVLTALAIEGTDRWLIDTRNGTEAATGGD